MTFSPAAQWQNRPTGRCLLSFRFLVLTGNQMAVLGEMTMLSGGRIILSKNPSSIDEYGNMRMVSYVAQTPWLRNETIRENILFGSPWDEQRYREVLDCCALNPDLDVLEDGDATEIGAKGISLSGANYKLFCYFHVS